MLRKIGFVFLVGVLIVGSWAFVVRGGCIKGKGPISEIELNIKPIHGINIIGSMDVNIKKGDEQKVLVNGYENVIEVINLDVDNGLWNVKFNKCVKKTGDLKIVVTLPEIDELVITGSGNILSSDKFENSNVSLLINGSGNIDFSTDADDVKAEIRGSGNILLTGECDSFESVIKGSGDIKAFEFVCKHSEVDIKGSGDVNVHVTKSLDVSIKGSGDVQYKGKAERVNADIKGVGEVKKITD